MHTQSGFQYFRIRVRSVACGWNRNNTKPEKIFHHRKNMRGYHFFVSIMLHVSAFVSSFQSPRRKYSIVRDVTLRQAHKIAVVGGGLAGLSTTYHLLDKTGGAATVSSDKHVQVTVFDRAPVGTTGASAVAGGYVSVMRKSLSSFFALANLTRFECRRIQSSSSAIAPRKISVSGSRRFGGNQPSH